MKLNSKSINYNVQTVDELVSLDGLEGDTVVVTDENRGGVFVYREDNVGTNNGGTIFNGWTRQYDGAVNVKWFGAVGDGVTDDTVALQNALDNCLDIYFPQNSFLISKQLDDTMLFVRSNTNIKADYATIFCNDTASTSYNMILLSGVENVKIESLNIIGDRLSHTGATGEWGMGISILDSENVIIKDINASNCWGDGIYIGYLSNTTFSKNIVIDSCTLDNNRRQGLSVVAGKNIKIVNSTFINTNGTAPAAGIDLESDPSNQNLSDITIDSCYFENNNSGVVCYKIAFNKINASITNCKFYNNRQAAIWFRASNISIENNIIVKDDNVQGFNSFPHIMAYGSSDVTICNNQIISNHNAIAERGGISLWNGCSNFIISGNIIKDTYDSGISLYINNNVGYGNIENINVNNNMLINCGLPNANGAINIGYSSSHRYINININYNNIIDSRSVKTAYNFYFSSDSNVDDIYNIDISKNKIESSITTTNKIKYLNPYYRQQITSYNQTLTAGSWIFIPLINNIKNDGTVQTQYSEVTVMKKGMYSFDLYCQIQNITQCNLSVNVNGQNIGISTGQVFSALSQTEDSISLTLELNAGDVVKAQIYVVSSTTPYLRANSWLTLYKL